MAYILPASLVAVLRMSLAYIPSRQQQYLMPVKSKRD